MKKILLFFFLGVATVAIAQDNNPILNSSNASLSITNFRGSGTTNNLGGTPLGTVGGTATGELGQKVIVIGSSGIATNDPSVVSAPGATPSPSPAKVVNIQGSASGIPVPTTTTPKQYTGAPDSFSPRTSNGTVFTLAAGEIGFIQNLAADAPLAVKKGASASTSSFSFILATGTDVDDGKGGAVKITDWIGAVSVANMAGSNARYIAWKQAP